MSDSVLAYEVRKAIGLPRMTVLWLCALIFGTVPVPFAAAYYRDERLGTEPVPIDEFDPVGLATSQLTISAVFLVVFGVLLAAHEFTGGALRGSVLAVPTRRPILVAKLKVAAVAAGSLALIALPVNFVVTNEIIGPPHRFGLLDAGVLRSLLGAALYLVLMALFAVGAGFVFRSGLVAIAILFPLLLTVSTILSNVPVDWISTAAQLLPDVAGARMMRAHTPADALLGPISGGIVLMMWVVGATALAALSLERRDVTS